MRLSLSMMCFNVSQYLWGFSSASLSVNKIMNSCMLGTTARQGRERPGKCYKSNSWMKTGSVCQMEVERSRRLGRGEDAERVQADEIDRWRDGNRGIEEKCVKTYLLLKQYRKSGGRRVFVHTYTPTSSCSWRVSGMVTFIKMPCKSSPSIISYVSFSPACAQVSAAPHCHPADHRGNYSLETFTRPICCRFHREML